jgi:hypothetical protein
LSRRNHRAAVALSTSCRPANDAELFFRYEASAGWFDMRDLGAVLDHEESAVRIR